MGVMGIATLNLSYSYYSYYTCLNKCSLDGAKRNPGFIRQTLHRSEPLPSRATTDRTECIGESMTSASRPAV